MEERGIHLGDFSAKDKKRKREERVVSQEVGMILQRDWKPGDCKNK